jgi:small GTP-binding protein
MTDTRQDEDERFRQALRSVERTLDRYSGCSDQEKELLRGDLESLRQMQDKLTKGRVDIVVFGEISTGKSALINALVGEAVAQVDVRGGWTKEVWHVSWDGCGYCVPGLGDSLVVLVDTPGLNEVGGADRGKMAHEAAQQADLILFVTDSDLNETEFSALSSLAQVNKPVILVFNKIDLYSREQRERLMEVLRDERLDGVLQPENVIPVAADPREVEYVVEAPDGSTRTEWRKPDPDVTGIKTRILEVLEKDGLALLALNAAMYAADKSDRVAAIRVQVRSNLAARTVWTYAVVKSVAVGINNIPVADVVGGSAVDAAMIVTLAHIYGIEMSWTNARKLITAIAQAAGWVVLSELTTHLASWALKTATLGFGFLLTALPQGAAAGYGSYIVGQAARYYFEHGASWGGESPKAVVKRILKETDKESVIDHLKEEIKQKLLKNRYSRD